MPTKKELTEQLAGMQEDRDQQLDRIENMVTTMRQLQSERTLEQKAAKIAELRREIQKLKTHIVITQNQQDPQSWPVRVLNRLFPNDPTYSLDQLKEIARDKYPGTIRQYSSLKSFIKAYFHVRSLVKSDRKRRRDKTR